MTDFRLSKTAVAITLVAVGLPLSSWIMRPKPAVATGPAATHKPVQHWAATRPARHRHRATTLPADKIYVHEYTRANGTVVHAHWRVARR